MVESIAPVAPRIGVNHHLAAKAVPAITTAKISWARRILAPFMNDAATFATASMTAQADSAATRLHAGVKDAFNQCCMIHGIDAAKTAEAPNANMAAAAIPRLRAFAAQAKLLLAIASPKAGQRAVVAALNSMETNKKSF